MTRYKAAIREHSSIPQLVGHIEQWFETWSTSSRLFKDGWAPETDQARQHAISVLRKDLDRLCDIVARERAAVHRYHPDTRRNVPADGTGMQLTLPGHLRPNGPRHDNDHANILEISVEPSQAELVCTPAPYIPALTWSVCHPHRSGSTISTSGCFFIISGHVDTMLQGL